MRGQRTEGRFRGRLQALEVWDCNAAARVEGAARGAGGEAASAALPGRAGSCLALKQEPERTRVEACREAF